MAAELDPPRLEDRWAYSYGENRPPERYRYSNTVTLRSSRVTEALAALHESAERMGFARQLFNDAVRGYNDAVRQFPTRLLSGLFGFGSAGTL